MPLRERKLAIEGQGPGYYTPPPPSAGDENDGVPRARELKGEKLEIPSVGSVAGLREGAHSTETDLQKREITPRTGADLQKLSLKTILYKGER